MKKAKLRTEMKSPGTRIGQKCRPQMNKLVARRTEKKTIGTLWAEEIRSQCNKLTRAEREALLVRAMQIAYGVDVFPKQARRHRTR